MNTSPTKTGSISEGQDYQLMINYPNKPTPTCTAVNHNRPPPGWWSHWLVIMDLAPRSWDHPRIVITNSWDPSSHYSPSGKINWSYRLLELMLPVTKWSLSWSSPQPTHGAHHLRRFARQLHLAPRLQPAMAALRATWSGCKPWCHKASCSGSNDTVAPTNHRETMVGNHSGEEPSKNHFNRETSSGGCHSWTNPDTDAWNRWLSFHKWIDV